MMLAFIELLFLAVIALFHAFSLAPRPAARLRPQGRMLSSATYAFAAITASCTRSACQPTPAHFMRGDK